MKNVMFFAMAISLVFSGNVLAGNLSGFQQGEIKGNVVVKDSLNMHGIITGDVEVPRGSYFELHGIVQGNVTSDKGSRVAIHGIVEGTLKNNGGQVEIYGIVKNFTNRYGGKVLIDPESIVNGKKGG